MKYFGCLLLLVSYAVNVAGVNAEESTDCSGIEDAGERLACFDKMFSSKNDIQPSPEIQSEPASIPDQTGAATPATDPIRDAEPAPAIEEAAVVSGAAAAASKADAEREEAGTERREDEERGFFGDPKVNLTTSIAAIRRADKQKMVFRLENDEIWMQTTPRPLPFREGDTVTIKNATMGGYFMKSNKGTSTRVSRIR